MTSINTNISALISVQTLTDTQNSLQRTQKRVSTGYNVADAVDNGAIFAIAQAVRLTITNNSSANQNLGNLVGFFSTANTAAQSVSDRIGNPSVTNSLAAFLTQLTTSSYGGTSTEANLAQSYQDALGGIVNNIQGAAYQGYNLLSTSTDLSFVVDGNLNSFAFSATNAYAIISGISILSTQNITAGTQAQSVLSGTLQTVADSIGRVLNLLGSATNRVQAQITFNAKVSDALNTGLSSLVDADLTRESASLASLQIKQQLGTQSLSIANQAPNVLLNLFR